MIENCEHFLPYFSVEQHKKEQILLDDLVGFECKALERLTNYLLHSLSVIEEVLRNVLSHPD
jgi:hypothetical protein